jgi:hypothetical protein
MPDQDEAQKALRLVSERIKKNGGEVVSGKAIPKSRDAYLVTVEIEGFDGERHTIVTRDEVGG